MGPDDVPDDVGLAGNQRWSIAKEGAAVRSPSHLVEARRSLDSLHAEAPPEALASLQILNELVDRGVKELLLSGSQARVRVEELR